MSSPKKNKWLEYGVASIILPGQKESGDLYIVKETDNQILIAVVDGLGHGSEAASAAKLAVNELDHYAHESVIALTKFCHERLKGTRGVVIALVAISKVDETLTWLSIGNVEGMLLRSEPQLNPSNPVYESIIMRPGVIGFRLPPLYASVMSISKGDLIILSTDGISDDYTYRLASDARFSYELSNTSGERTKEELLKEAEHFQHDAAYSALKQSTEDLNIFKTGRSRKSPQELADFICKRFNKGNDDALVLVAKYL